eukprot:m.1009753 g.1009753  ORF g.1009753 m.1009753 type:complete len:1337 (+) comp24059_c0_seq13:512-4522(+)
MAHKNRCQSCAIDFTSRSSHLKHTAKFCDYASERDRAAALRALRSIKDKVTEEDSRNSSGQRIRSGKREDSRYGNRDRDDFSFSRIEHSSRLPNIHSPAQTKTYGRGSTDLREEQRRNAEGRVLRPSVSAGSRDDGTLEARFLRHNTRRVGSARGYGDDETTLSPQLQKLLGEREEIVARLKHPASADRNTATPGNSDGAHPQRLSAQGTRAADVQNVRMLRQSYLANGGTDAAFLQNLQEMEMQLTNRGGNTTWEQPMRGRGLLVPHQAPAGTGMSSAMERLQEAEMDLKLMGLALRTEEMRQKMQHAAPNNGLASLGQWPTASSSPWQQAPVQGPPWGPGINGAVGPQYYPAMGFRIAWDNLSADVHNHQTLVLCCGLGEYETQLDKYNIVQHEKVVAIAGVTGKTHRTISLAEFPKYRGVDVAARPTVYAIIELYEEGAEPTLMGSTCFHLFNSDGTLREGPWRIDLHGRHSVQQLCMRVVHGAVADNAIPYVGAEGYRIDPLAVYVHGFRAHVLDSQLPQVAPPPIRHQSPDVSVASGSRRSQHRTPAVASARARPVPASDMRPDDDAVSAATPTPPTTPPRSPMATATRKPVAVPTEMDSPTTVPVPPPAPMPAPNSILVHVVAVKYPNGPKSLRLKVLLIKRPSEEEPFDVETAPSWTSQEAPLEHVGTNEYVVNDCGALPHIELAEGTCLHFLVLSEDVEFHHPDVLPRTKDKSVQATVIGGAQQIGFGTMQLIDPATGRVNDGIHVLPILLLGKKLGKEVPNSSIIVKIHLGNAQQSESDLCPIQAWRPHQAVVNSVPYTTGDGIDVYVDMARFLPSDCTATKIVGGIYDENLALQGPEIVAFSSVTSDIYFPEFNSRTEYRSIAVKPRSILLFRLYTVDRQSNQVAYVGFAVVQMFKVCGTDRDVTGIAPRGTKLALYDGGHQARIYPHNPITYDEAVVFRNDDVSEIPCASLLVRIVRPRKNRSGKPLSTMGTIPSEEWEAEGVVQPMPSYISSVPAVYESNTCQPSVHEAMLFETLLRRPRGDMYALPSELDRKPASTTAISVENWMRSRLDHVGQGRRDSAVLVPSLSLKRVAEYEKKYGVALAVDTAINLTNDNKLTYISMHLATPGQRADSSMQNLSPNDTSHRRAFNALLKWASPNSTVPNPMWTDGLLTYQDIELTARSVAVLVVWRARAGTKPVAVAWAVVPLMLPESMYVNHGFLHLPLFRGVMSKDILQALVGDNKQSVYELLGMFVEAKKIKHMTGSSLIVHICDGRRSSEILSALQIEQEYMPRDRDGAIPSHYKQDAKASSAKTVRMVLGRKAPEFQDTYIRGVMPELIHGYFS